jgi:hypothetical protein
MLCRYVPSCARWGSSASAWPSRCRPAGRGLGVDSTPATQSSAPGAPHQTSPAEQVCALLPLLLAWVYLSYVIRLQVRLLSSIQTITQALRFQTARYSARAERHAKIAQPAPHTLPLGLTPAVLSALKSTLKSAKAFLTPARTLCSTSNCCSADSVLAMAYGI